MSENQKEKTYHYKIETWNKTNWKGTKREQKTTVERLVKRDSHGKFVKGSPVIKEIQVKTYGSGLYSVGYDKSGKAITRLKKGKSNEEWINKRKEILKNAQILRCSLALNDIPYKGTEYYGFRIVAYSRIKGNLIKIYPQKMYKKLIQFIERCLKYRSDDFWFSHYLNYMGKIPPEPSNASIGDNNRYELLWTKRKTGSTMRHETGRISEL